MLVELSTNIRAPSRSLTKTGYPLRMTRRPNTLERREQITGAMIRLLARRGLQGATMQALSRETGLTQGLLHYHFASKDEVVLAAVERLAAGILARVRAAPGPDGRGHASGEPASGEP
ncbi:MAG: TetR family transcriptional regulator, partial [Myxococcales bacterium]|nr:TetR family transcriptional regulator [Myxococcales bacterium]